MLDQLEKAVFAKHPRPWRVYNQPLRRQISDTKIIEIQDADGKSVIPWPGFDDRGTGSAAGRLRLARLIVRLANEVGPF